jgi:hypothetical protein
MEFLNLSLFEFLGLAGVISAGLIALYLLDHSKRRQVVATLKFWSASNVPSEFKRARKIQQPWSLLLQIVSMLLLLLAIAGPRLGGNANAVRDHVLILDTSAWMGARARQGILLDQAKQLALDYLRMVPADDRVMIVRADALPTPVTAFETRREQITNAIQQSQPSASALNLQQAIEFAQRAQRLQAQRAGEIVFAGAGRISREEADGIAAPKNLRVLQVPSAGENVGIRKLGLRRSPSKPDTWEAFVGLKNDGTRPRDIILELHFGGATVATKNMTLAPGSEPENTYSFTNPRAPFLEAVLRSANGRGDAFPQDDRAQIDVPEEKQLKIAVYSAENNLLQPLIASNAQVQASFFTPAQYDAQALADPAKKPDILIFDRFSPPQAPQNANILWIEPPAGSPFAVKATANKAKLERWRSETPLASGLYTKDVELATTQVFNLAQGDQSVAEVAAGPIVVGRPGTYKMAALGFHPVRSSMRYELATPLLVANILRWMAPETFRRLDVQAGTVGTVNIAVDKGADPANIKITGDDKRPLPFTIEGDSLRFFSGAPGNVHVATGDRESIYSLTLPDVAEVAWKPAVDVTKGVPRTPLRGSSSASIWPWLAILGGIGLLIDWLIYGRSHVLRLQPASKGASGTTKFPSFKNWRKAS